MSFTIRRKIPTDVLRAVVLNHLVQGGRTIRDIDKDGGLASCGHVSQQQYMNKKVWHTLEELKETVAENMEIDSELLGPNSRSDEFSRKTTGVLANLKKKGEITYWGDSDWRLPFRLTHIEAYGITEIKPVSYMVSPPRYNEQPEIKFGEEEDMKRVFSSIMTRGKKDNTYKFALAKTILDYCQRNDPCIITYDYLAGKFLEHYWYQEYKFKMKQDFKIKSNPEVITIIRDTFGDNPPIDFKLADKDGIVTAKREILKRVFGHARRKTSQVVPRFQNIPGDDGGLVEYGIFYDYSDDAQIITIRPEAFDFFKRNYMILSKVVIIEWAKFLEKINGSMPYLVSKIEVPNKEREPLTAYYGLYHKHEDCCFYCRTGLERDYTHVDHVIPWSYMFSNDPWNLVLACRSCNLKKSNNLPQTEFKNLLITRNGRYYDVIKKMRDSLNMLDVGRGWEHEIDNHYETCGTYGFGKVRLP